MKTQNELIRILKDVADRHPQINTTIADEQFENLDNAIYPLVHIAPGAWKIEGGKVSQRFLLLILDLGSEDGSHRQENLSDTQLIGADIVAALQEENSGEDLLFEMFGEATKIVDGKGDNASGWILELKASQTYEKKYCETPYAEGN